MKIAIYRGVVLAVLLRNEHCPPHVHAGGADWEARFKFSYWHDVACLWDVTPVNRTPRAASLEGMRRLLMSPDVLRRARSAWWRAVGNVCLENLMWDPSVHRIVAPRSASRGASRVMSAEFDAGRYSTIVHLGGRMTTLEIPHGQG